MFFYYWPSILHGMGKAYRYGVCWGLVCLDLLKWVENCWLNRPRIKHRPPIIRVPCKWWESEENLSSRIVLLVYVSQLAGVMDIHQHLLTPCSPSSRIQDFLYFYNIPWKFIIKLFMVLWVILPWILESYLEIVSTAVLTRRDCVTINIIYYILGFVVSRLY